MHLMRTYGTHGGEQQLSQFFGIEDEWSQEELFVNFYKDKDFEDLMSLRAPNLKLYTLFNRSINPKDKWKEFFILIILLPYLQFKLLKIIYFQKPKVVISHGFHAGVLYWIFAIFIKQITWIYFHRASKEKKFLIPFKILFWPTYQVMGNSKSACDSLSFFVKEKKIRILNNGINILNFDKRSKVKCHQNFKERNKVNIICVGRLIPNKGHSILLDAISILESKYKNKIKFFIAGEGIKKNEIKKQIISLKLNKTVTMLGHVNNIPSILKDMDIFLNGSLMEGMSNAVLEGMCSKLPSVVIDAPGVSECHDINTAFIVKKNPKQISKKIEILINEKKLRKKMGLAARKRIEENFSIKKNRKKFINFYQEWLSQ